MFWKSLILESKTQNLVRSIQCIFDVLLGTTTKLKILLPCYNVHCQKVSKILVVLKSLYSECHEKHDKGAYIMKALFHGVLGGKG